SDPCAVHECHEITLRRPSFLRGLCDHPLPLPRHLPHLRRGLRIPHHLFDAPPHLHRSQHAAAVHLRAHADAPVAHADAPVAHDELRVHALVRHLRHAHHGHAARHALQHRVPAAVRHEAPHRRVRQHPHLVAPLHHDAVLEAPAHLRLRLPERGHDVLPDDAEVRPPAPLEAEEELVELLPRHRGQAPEGDVDHGARRLGIEPLHVLGAVLLEDAGLVVAGREHGADGEHVVRSHGSEGAHLELLARVDKDDIGRVGGISDQEGRQVADGPGRQPGELHDERRVVAVLGDDAGAAVEVVVVDGEHGGRLDPVQRGRDAALARDAFRPREQERVQDAGDRAAPRRERVHEPRDAARARGVEGRHVGVERARVGAPDVPGLRAVGEREELEAAVLVSAVVEGPGGAVGLGRGREHAGVPGLGGGEGFHTDTT
ncbi:hypothetical protein PVAP13_4NG212422, partial [Panicum virgatum]